MPDLTISQVASMISALKQHHGWYQPNHTVQQAYAKWRELGAHLRDKK